MDAWLVLDSYFILCKECAWSHCCDGSQGYRVLALRKRLKLSHGSSAHPFHNVQRKKIFANFESFLLIIEYCLLRFTILTRLAVVVVSSLWVGILSDNNVSSLWSQIDPLRWDIQMSSLYGVSSHLLWGKIIWKEQNWISSFRFYHHKEAKEILL